MSLTAIVLGALLSCAGYAADPPPAPPPAAPPTTTAPSDDPGTKLVIVFYKALLQEQPPTLDQENALFPAKSVIRDWMIASGKGGDKDPVVLLGLRRQRDQFLPKDLNRGDVQVSSSFRWAPLFARRNDGAEPGTYVLAYVRDRATPRAPSASRTVRFVLEDGKLDPGRIRLGSDGGFLLNEFMKVGEIDEQKIKELAK